MKTITSLSFILLFFVSARANVDTLLQKQMDSMRYVLLKPRLDDYLERAAKLVAVMNSGNKDSVRLCAKQLQKSTDALIATADFIYGREEHYGTSVGMAYSIPTGQYVPAVIPYYCSTGTVPPVRDQLLKISDKSENIRWSIGNREKQLAKIDAALSQLQGY